MGYTRHRYHESFILDPGRKSGVWHAKPMPSPIQEMLAFNQVSHARWHGKCQMVCFFVVVQSFLFLVRCAHKHNGLLGLLNWVGVLPRCFL
jgi:hypothetical protein